MRNDDALFRNSTIDLLGKLQSMLIFTLWALLLNIFRT